MECGRHCVRGIRVGGNTPQHGELRVAGLRLGRRNGPPGTARLSRLREYHPGGFAGRKTHDRRLGPAMVHAGLRGARDVP